MKQSYLIPFTSFFFLVLSLTSFGQVKDEHTLIRYFEFSKGRKWTVEMDGIKNMSYSKSPSLIRLTEIGSARYITYYDNTINKIFIHELVGRKLKFLDTVSVKVPFKRGYLNLMSYHMITLDSIVLAFNPTYNSKFCVHDSSVFLIDRKGKLLSIFNFENVPVPTWGKVNAYGDELRDVFPNYLNYLGFPLFYHKQLGALVGNFNSFIEPCGFCNNLGNKNVCYSGLLYLDKSKKFTPIPNISCGLDSGNFYALDLKYPKGTYNPNNGHIVYAFGFNNVWQIVDTALNVKKVKIESYILDTLYPLNKYYSDVHDYSRGEFLGFHFDKYTNTYYRTIRIGNNVFKTRMPEPTKARGQETYIVQVVDSNYKLLGEAIMPVNDWMVLADKGKAIMFNQNESSKTGKLVFREMNLVKREIPLSQYKEIIKGRMTVTEDPEEINYKNYVSELTKKRYSRYVIFNAENSCGSCRELMVSYMKRNISLFKEKNIGIVFITSNKEGLIDKFDRQVLPENILIDDKLIYRKYIPGMLHAAQLDLSISPMVLIKHTPSTMQPLYDLLDSYK